MGAPAAHRQAARPRDPPRARGVRRHPQRNELSLRRLAPQARPGALRELTKSPTPTPSRRGQEPPVSTLEVYMGGARLRAITWSSEAALPFSGRRFARTA